LAFEAISVVTVDSLTVR